MSAGAGAFDAILVANRGEIALRVMRTARAMGYRTVAVYEANERAAPHVRFADAACELPARDDRSPYLDIDAMLAAASASGAGAIHPGYGYLAERADFAERCAARGIVFIGPSPAAMRALGNKAAAKALLEGAGVPLLPGYHGTAQDDATLLAQAQRIGLPLMIKAAAGGGGRGMRLATAFAELPALLAAARSEATAAFGDGTLLLERALLAPRHIEVQIFGDAHGNAIAFDERDCSVQRRHQKLIEESPSPAVDAALRERLAGAALAVARAVAYAGAGTVEFLLDADGTFAFIELNARLQVEHPVTEAIAGVDLVEWQIRVARGEPLPALPPPDRTRAAHAIEARLCAEDPAREFLPQSGTLVRWEAPPGVRTEHALVPGAAISPRYDSMLAKIVATGATREDARRQLVRALETCVALGVPTNRDALLAMLRDPVFVAGDATTRFVADRFAPEAFAVAPPARAFALAAALRYARAARRGAFGLWTSWSSTQRPPATVVLAAAGGAAHARTGFGDALAVTLHAGGGDTYGVTVADETFAVSVELLGEQARVRVDGGPLHSVPVAEANATLWFAFEGRTYAFDDRTFAGAGAGRGSEASGAPALRSPMSGRIVDVRAVTGEPVRRGDVLVVLEAMKMEHRLAAPDDARVAAVPARAGAQTSAGDVLVAFEPTAAGEAREMPR